MNLSIPRATANFAPASERPPSLASTHGAWCAGDPSSEPTWLVQLVPDVHSLSRVICAKTRLVLLSGHNEFFLASGAPNQPTGLSSLSPPPLSARPSPHAGRDKRVSAPLRHSLNFGFLFSANAVVA